MMIVEKGFIDISGSDVTVKTNIADFEPIAEHISLIMKEQKAKNPKQFEFALSVSQARVIKEILEHYVNSFYSFQVLTEKSRAKAKIV